MKTRILFIVPALLLLVYNCSKKTPDPVKNVIFGLTADSIKAPADGTTIIHINCQLNGEATLDRSSILFKSNVGDFVGSNDTTLVQAAQFINNTLVASVALTVPQTPGILVITAQPSLPGVPYSTYIISDTITIYPSVPVTLQLVPSNSGINSSYGSEVTFTGTLYNVDTGKVSLNYRVKFEDFLDGETSAGGAYRATDSLSDTSSQVSTIYSTGAYALGTRIHIRCTLLDSAGNKTPIADSAYIYINK